MSDTHVQQARVPTRLGTFGIQMYPLPVICGLCKRIYARLGNIDPSAGVDGFANMA